jgi:hypothetical protein
MSKDWEAEYQRVWEKSRRLGRAAAAQTRERARRKREEKEQASIAGQLAEQYLLDTWMERTRPWRTTRS